MSVLAATIFATAGALRVLSLPAMVFVPARVVPLLSPTIVLERGIFAT
jgi:hypothetical protein